MDISVIIPVYNVEKYLRRCLNSVLRQEGITTEIILVDDGSTDSSGCICDEYFTQHTNIKCLHVENGGPATAKNIGYNFATGRYIAFIDSDDEVRPDMFSSMVSFGDQHNADIICCNYMQINEDGSTEHLEHSGQEYVLGRNEAIKALLLKDKIFSQCWTKIYKHSTLEAHSIRNPEGFKTDEDFIFNIQAFDVSNIVCVIDRPLYIYTHRSTSLSKDYFNSHICQYIDNRIFRLEKLEKIIHDRYPELEEYSVYHIIFYYNELLGRICLFPIVYNDPRISKVIQYIRSHSVVLMKYHTKLGFSYIGTQLIRYLPQIFYLYYRKWKNSQIQRKRHI